jgi:tetratricopeptide (TPR) repeat protein
MQSAQAYLEEALGEDVDDTEMKLDALYTLSQLKSQAGKLTEAYGYWERIYMLNPEYKDIAQKISNFSRIRGNSEIINLLSLPLDEFKSLMVKAIQAMGHQISKEIPTKDNKFRFMTTFKEGPNLMDAIVETAKWTNPVGDLQIKELVKVVQDYRAYKGIYMTPSVFTEQAVKTTETYPIDLIDNDALKKLLKKIRK